MSWESNIALVRGAYEALDAGDFEAAAAHYAEDLELTNVATTDVYRGRDGFLQHAHGWAAALPDGRLEILHIGGGDGTVTIEYMARGADQHPRPHPPDVHAGGGTLL